MKCPNCKTEVFDIYTTEERIRALYKVNLTMGWALQRLNRTIDMLADRLEKGWDLPPLLPEWILQNLREITSKMKTVS